MKPKYAVYSHIGIWWKGGKTLLGVYRWAFLARLRGWFHVKYENPYRAVTVEKIN